jgi:hypothetical protein
LLPIRRPAGVAGSRDLLARPGRSDPIRRRDQRRSTGQSSAKVAAVVDSAWSTTARPSASRCGGRRQRDQRDEEPEPGASRPAMRWPGRGAACRGSAPRVRAGEDRCEKFLYELNSRPASGRPAAALGRQGTTDTRSQFTPPPKSRSSQEYVMWAAPAGSQAGRSRRLLIGRGSADPVGRVDPVVRAGAAGGQTHRYEPFKPPIR